MPLESTHYTVITSVADCFTAHYLPPFALLRITLNGQQTYPCASLPASWKQQLNED
jgi:hypothetical protein